MVEFKFYQCLSPFSITLLFYCSHSRYFSKPLHKLPPSAEVLGSVALFLCPVLGMDHTRWYCTRRYKKVQVLFLYLILSAPPFHSQSASRDAHGQQVSIDMVDDDPEPVSTNPSSHLLPIPSHATFENFAVTAVFPIP